MPLIAAIPGYVWGIASVAAAAVGTGMSMYGQQQQARAGAAAADYNNDLAKTEARNKELEAAEAIRRERASNRARLSEIRARLSASGTLTTEGTPLALLGESAGRFELGIQDAARASRMQVDSLRAQGRMGLWEADQMSSAAGIGILGTGLAGLGNAAGNLAYGSALGIYTKTKPLR